jgi:hypothetical protein
MPAGRVCDLHVRDAVGIGGDHGIEVVDIDGEMVEVAEQREVGDSRVVAPNQVTV